MPITNQKLKQFKGLQRNIDSVPVRINELASLSVEFEAREREYDFGSRKRVFGHVGSIPIRARDQRLVGVQVR